jgi:hypothetical protein
MTLRYQPVGCRSLRWNRAFKLALPPPPPGHSAGGLPAHPAERRRSRCLAWAELWKRNTAKACRMQQQLRIWNWVQKEISRKLVLLRTTLIFD